MKEWFLMKVEAKIEFDTEKTAKIAEKTIKSELYSSRAKTLLNRKSKNLTISIDGDRVASRASVNSILRLIDVCLQIQDIPE